MTSKCYDLNIKGLKAVVFDWDNTLAESRSSLIYAINQILPQYNLPQWDIVKNKRDNNLSFRDNFPRIFGNNANEAYEKYVQVYLDIVKDRITTFPKTKEVLNFLKQNRVALMIMTNKDRRLLEYELPLLFDPKLFDNIVCGHEAQQDKPSHHHLLWTLKDHLSPQEISPQTVWVIGDSPVDSTCANQGNARAIRIGKPFEEASRPLPESVLFYNSFVDFYENLLFSNTK